MAKPILVVDSSREFGILIRQSLEEEGDYTVKLAHSGQQAMEAVSDQKFEVALVDFSLPDIPGPELVRQLTSLDPALSIVAIPAAGSADQLADVSVAGVLTKPFYLPDLARLLEKTLNKQAFSANWIQWEQPEEKPPEPSENQQPTSINEPSEPSLAATLQTETAPSEDALRAALDRSSARAALLWQEGRPPVSAGLSGDQIGTLLTKLKGLGSQIQQQRAVTQYVKLPDQDEDLLLLASPWRSNLTLVTLFSADSPFRQVRRSTQDLAQSLESYSKETINQPQTEQAEVELTPSATDEPQNLPEDWVPEREFSPAQRSMLDELAAIEPPPADPAPTSATMPQIVTEPQLPDDWIPTNQRSQAVLSMIDQPSVSPPSGAKPASHATSPDKLVYNLVLIPRFTDHQLTGQLAATLEDWVRRVCLAWDWRADHLEIKPDYLFLQVELDAASAPGQAAQQLKADLARKVLSEKIEWNTSLPSGRFFARKHLLSSGAAPESHQISRFVQQVRQSQGLSR